MKVQIVGHFFLMPEGDRKERRELRPGQVVEATEAEAALWIAHGHARAIDAHKTTPNEPTADA